VAIPPKALVAALRRHSALHPQSVTDPQRAGLAERLPGVARKLSGQAHSLGGQARSLGGQARTLPGADDLPASTPSPTIVVEPSLDGLVVHISPGPPDGRDAEQRFPDTPQGRAVAAHYASELAKATKLPINDMTGGHRAPAV
jgi:hypothetical protein